MASTACHRTRTGTSSSCRPNWPRPRSRNLPASWRPFMREPPYPTEVRPYGRALVDLARRRDEVLCLSGDLTRQCEVDLFQAEFPERFIHAGMAEANMMGMAGALARCGFVPFVHTFGVFATRRPLDQIINAIAFPNLNVRIMGFMPGVSSPGEPSHQAIGDVALMRALPNMTIVDVADAVEVRQVASVIVDVDGPVYVRLKRGEIPVIFGEDHRLRLDRADVLRRGEDVALFASGMMLAPALAAARLLDAHGVRVSLVNVPVIKPLDAATVLDVAKRRGWSSPRRTTPSSASLARPSRRPWPKPGSAGRCAASGCATRSRRGRGPARTCSASTGCRRRRWWTRRGPRSAAAASRPSPRPPPRPTASTRPSSRLRPAFDTPAACDVQ